MTIKRLALAALVALDATRVAAEPRRSLRSVRRAAGEFPNGDFESGKVHPWIAVNQGSGGDPDYSHLQIASLGDNSQYAASLSAASAGTGWMYTLVSGNWGTNYTISLDYQAVVAPSPDCEFHIRGSDDNDPDNDQTTVVPMIPGDWASTSLVYSHFEQQVFWLYLGVVCPNGANSTVLIDNIQMEATGVLQPGSCPGGATVVNGDFETGNISPWILSTGADQYIQVISPGYNSAYALQVTDPAAQYFDTYWWNDLSGVCFNYYYSYSFAVNWINYGTVPSDPHDGCVLSVSAYNCAEDPFDVYIYPTTEGWQEQSFNCTAQRDTVQMSFGVICGEQPPTTTWSLQMDNVALTLQGGPAPPPAPSGTPTSTPSTAAELDRKQARELVRPRWA